ncbi:MAG TPA: ATPase, T2SS/T4P/T4SS family [Candidatus Saccharimonadales bacterium]|nr:ATPase, T2SS/T4P/T4SS family [Candidatus Saccharimonadales bacterium]
MHVSDALVQKLLKASGKVTVDQIKEAHQQAETERHPLQDIVVRNNILSEGELTRLFAQEIDVPFAEFNVDNLSKETLQLIPERIARQYRAVAFSVDEDGVVFVAMEDPDDIQAINFLQKQIGRPIRVHIAPESLIQTAIDQYSGSGNVSTELAKVIAIEDKEEVEESVAEEDVAEDSPIAQTLNLIIDYGIKTRASDVHIEPHEDVVIVRYRVDGVLHEANKLPRKVLNALVSRIKILANLKIDEHRAPQDGRFKISADDRVYALRVSTLPVVDGEKVVMRILDESTKASDLDDLGYWGESLRRVQDAIVQPHGMILVTGPTGSGKSTSLFSVLSKLNSPTVNISTIEDPVEYRIVGVNQTQLNPLAGMTFATGLRALLRQDPNIIMVGEIRDVETADLAVQAALTGHLVFSTLHTNDAATCLPRLLDMGVEPFLIASTIRIVIGQRLVRRLCPECREEYAPDDAVMARVKETFNLAKASDFTHLQQLEKEAIAAGIGTSSAAGDAKTNNAPSVTDKTITKLWRAHDKGCNNCNHTGYKGRIGIYEVLENNQAIEKLIVTSSTSEEIEEQAISDGMVKIQIDGFIKAIRGETSVEEIMRATSTEL